MVIDCDRCRMRDVACRDCVVTVLLELPDAGERLELDVVEARAISVLAGSGLVPPLRLVAPSPPDQPGRRDRSRRRAQPDGSDTYDDGHGAGASRAG